MGKPKQSKKTTKRNAGSTKPAAIKDTPVIPNASSSATQQMPMMVCRLCESKDGPFFDIFDPDKNLLTKLEATMPFMIKKDDKLPKTICFRCSAKVEEYQEFLHKCLKTQDSLCASVAKELKIIPKQVQTPSNSKSKRIWEDTLTKSNLSNDDICDAVIKKAVERIRDSPGADSSLDKAPIMTLRSKNKSLLDEIEPNKRGNKQLPLKITKAVKTVLKKGAKNITKKVSVLHKKPAIKDRIVPNETIQKEKETKNKPDESIPIEKDIKNKPDEPIPVDKDINNKPDEPIPIEKDINNKPDKPVPENPSQNRITSVLLNGYGTLYQCKICTRNFITKEAVLAHVCSEEGRKDSIRSIQSAEATPPPKVSNVVYINTKNGGVVKNTLPLSSQETETREISNRKTNTNLTKAPPKPKPKIGPASKVKRQHQTYEVHDENGTTKFVVRQLENHSVVDIIRPRPDFDREDLGIGTHPYPVALLQTLAHGSKKRATDDVSSYSAPTKEKQKK